MFKEPKLLREIADCRIEAGSIKEKQASCHIRKQGSRQRSLGSGLRSQFEDAPTGPKWENLSIKKKSNSNRQKYIKYIKIRKFQLKGTEDKETC